MCIKYPIETAASLLGTTVESIESHISDGAVAAVECEGKVAISGRDVYKLAGKIYLQHTEELSREDVEYRLKRFVLPWRPRQT